MPLLTYLAWVQPIINNPRLIFKHVKNKRLFTYGENFNKKVAILISIHESSVILTSYLN